MSKIYYTSAKPVKYFAFLAMLYLLAIITSFTLSPRLITFSVPVFHKDLVMPGGLFIFPFIYFLSDIITEVYGYARARQVVWFSIIAAFIYVFLTQFSVHLPTPDFWPYQQDYEQVFNAMPTIFLGNFVGLLVGSFVNNYTLSKMKIYFKGRYLWLRALGSTALGEALVGLIGGTAAFMKTLGLSTALIQIIISVYIFNLIYEIIAMPFIYFTCSALKRMEGIDKYDLHTNFNPFSLKLDDNH